MKKQPANLVIRFCDFFDSSIATRSAIKNLFNIRLNNVKSIELNYENIDFISRSAVHQILIEKNRIESKGINVFNSSMSALLSKMFDAVMNYKRNNSNIKDDLTILEVNNNKDFNKLMLNL